MITTAPSVYTTAEVTTSNGLVYTVTQIVHNPGGNLDSGSSGAGAGTSAFFNNKGAVAGVFVVVGLVIVGVLAALGLLCFRRRRRQRLDREVTAAAIAASAGHNSGRSRLDEDYDTGGAAHPPSSAHHTGESYPSTVNSPMQQYSNYNASYGPAGGYDPYASQAPLSHSSHGAGGGGSSTGHNPFGYGAAVVGAGAAGAGGYHAVTRDGPDGGDDPYYFDPRDAQRYEDEPETPTKDWYGGSSGRGGYTDDPYGGYSDQNSIGTPPTERQNPLHVSRSFYPC